MNALSRWTALPTFATAIVVSFGLSGCAGLMSTSDVAESGLGTTSNGLDASTNVSVTKPEGYRYASARAYVTSQMPMIRREAASGGGDNIRALATLMGAQDTEAFGEWMQDNYARLFTDLKKPEMLVARISRLRQPTTL